MILCHICCSVDSHFFLRKLREKFPNHKIIGFFYNPNIHPYSEYHLRLLDVKRSCKMLGIELIEGEYDFESWFEVARALESEPEKGKRCEVCFDKRMIESAKKAYEIGAKYLTTTLLMSPKKDLRQLEISLNYAIKDYGLEFLALDFRKNGGTHEQFLLAKKDRLYKQDYCGCMFALKKQREQQKRFEDELCEPINGAVLPNSLNSRILLYEKRLRAEESKKEYKIIKERFLNYRLLSGRILKEKRVISSYILSYSHFTKERFKIRVEDEIEGVFYANRYEVILIELKS